MISGLAEKAVDKVFSHTELSKDDRELYVYGFFILLSHAFYFIITAICGVMLGVVLESILFYVLFSLIRGYAGGVHASKESICTVSTLLSILASITAIKVCLVLNLYVLPLAALFLSLPCILLFSPLDTEAKPLTTEERKAYKKKSCVIALLIFSAALVAFVLQLPGIFLSCAASLFLESLLLIAGKIKELVQSSRGQRD